MKPAVRRVLLFVAMVGAGLAAVFVLADPLADRRRAHVGELSDADKDAARLRIQAEDDARATQVVFPGEVEFDVLQAVEGPDGRIEERPAYRVKMQSGKPDSTGAFLAEGPVVTLLDRVTGAPTGTLSARSARFETGEAVGGGLKVDLARMSAERFSLIGDVRGTLRMADGHDASVSAERIDVNGALVHAPGRVTWSRDDMSLSGDDMTWDGDTGKLDFTRDATITLAETPERLGLELHAPGGLTMNLPPDAEDLRSASWGELRGPVTGVASDGTRLSAQDVHVDARAGTIRMAESASFEREADGRHVRLSAQHIELATDADGRWAIVQADGSVRVVSAPFAVLPSWMVTESMRMEGDLVTAPGDVTWSQAGVIATGHELDWDHAIGKLVYARDAQIAVDENSEQALAGLRVLAPGGMTWIVPPGATDPLAEASGELRGRVTGTLPDGTDFATDMLFFDGAARSFRLEGSAQFRRLADDRLSEVTAQRVTLGGDDAHRLALVSAEGEVVLLSGRLDVLPARLAAASLQREGTLVTSPDAVTWSRDGVVVTGTGMRYDETAGRLDLSHDAQITLTDPDGLLTELHGTGGLTWVAPPGAASANDGHGELRGHVTGRTSDGSTLDTARLAVDGPSRTLTLHGPSRASLAGDGQPLVVEGAEIVVRDIDTAPAVSTAESVTWSRAGLSGSATGMAWSETTGELHLDRSVRIAFETADEPFVLTSRGALHWTLPPGAGDALREGHGTLRDGVEGGSDALGRFRTELLALDGRIGRAVLDGPSDFLRRTPEEHIALGATQQIVVRSAPDGAPQHLTAEGGASAMVATAGARAPLHLSGDRLELDRIARTVELHGNALVTQGEGEELRSVAATESLTAVTDDQDQLTRVQARGSLVCRLGDMEVRGDELAWDVAGDVALLTGNCRLLWGGSVLDAAQVEVHPRAQEFRIVRASIRVRE